MNDNQINPVEMVMQELQSANDELPPPMFSSPSELASCIRQSANTLHTLATSVECCRDMAQALGYMDASTLLAVCAMNRAKGNNILGRSRMLDLLGALGNMITEEGSRNSNIYGASLFQVIQNMPL